MSKKRIIWTVVLIAVAVGITYGVYQYTRGNEKLSNVKAKFSLSADTLIAQFEKQDSFYYKKYDDKIIEVTGIMKNSSLGNFTIFLGDPGKLSAVKCELDMSFRNNLVFPPISTEVTVKGHFVGFQKDEMMGLGMDISLNRCIILNNEK